MHRSAAALTQLHSALTFFRDACADDDPARVLASGRIADALHNKPGLLRMAQRDGGTVYPHPGGRAWYRGSPPRVRAAYDTFFRERHDTGSFASCPSELPDSLLDGLADAFLAMRRWMSVPDDGRGIAGAVAQKPIERWERRRIASARTINETLAALDAWRLST